MPRRNLGKDTSSSTLPGLNLECSEENTNIQVSLSRPGLTKRGLGGKRLLRLSTRGKKDLFEPGGSRQALNPDVSGRQSQSRQLARSQA